MSLTPKQQAILEFLQRHFAKKGYMPSQREIADHFGFRSLGTVQDYLNYLSQYGLIEKTWNGKRATKILDSTTTTTTSSTNILALPLVGRVAAGRPIEAIDNASARHPIEVPASLMHRSGQHFVLQVVGLSMIGEGILEDDYVVIRKQPHAEKGQTVVALLDNEATIKKFWPGKKGIIELLSANPQFKPIVVDPTREFKIEGILTGVLRKVL